LAKFSRPLAALQCRTRPSRCTESITLNPTYISCRRVDLAVGRVGCGWERNGWFSAAPLRMS